MKAKSLRIGTLLLTVSAVTFAGYLWLGPRDLNKQRLAESVKRSEHVFKRYFDPDDAAAKQPMVEHVEYLDRLSSESADTTRNPFAFDAMAWCVRLAKLDERSDGIGQSGHMQRAIERCRELGISDCSEENLRAQVDGMDMVAVTNLSRN